MIVVRTRVYVRLCVLLGCLAATAVAQQLTERQALQLLRESPYYQELQARVEVTRAERRRATLYPNPSAGVSFEGAGRTDFYTVEQPLAINGRLRLLRRAGESAVAATQAQADYDLRQIEAAVRSAFQELIYAQKRKDTIAQSIEEINKLVQILRQREEAGEGSRFDRLRAEREVVERRSEVDDVEAAIAQARARLAGFLGERVAPEGIIAQGELNPTDSPPAVLEAMQSALIARGDYRSQEAALETLGVEAEAADRRRIPNPTLSGGLKRAQVGERWATGPVVSISIDLPLFNKGQAERQVAEAEARRVQARRAIIASQILADVRGAHQSLLIRTRAAERYEQESRQRAEELRRIAQIAYEEGELGILELVDSFRVAQQSQLRLLDLKAAAKLAEIELDRAMGAEVLP